MAGEIQRWLPAEFLSAEFRLWAKGLPFRHPFLVYAMVLCEEWPKLERLFLEGGEP